MKTMLLKTLIIAALAAAGFSAGAMPIIDYPVKLAADPASAKSAVDGIFASYAETAEALDVDSWLALWDDQGVKFVPGAPAIVGKAAIGDFASPRWKNLASRKMSIKVTAVDQSGDFALARGTFMCVETPKGASSPVTTDGWFLTTFRRQAGGGWKIYRDCIAPETAPK